MFINVFNSLKRVTASANQYMEVLVNFHSFGMVKDTQLAQKMEMINPGVQYKLMQGDRSHNFNIALKHVLKLASKVCTDISQEFNLDI